MEKETNDELIQSDGQSLKLLLEESNHEVDVSILGVRQEPLASSHDSDDLPKDVERKIGSQLLAVDWKRG